MATYSLRLSEQRYFTNGLIALGLASRSIDLRDVLRLLALYWDVHKRNGLNFKEVLSQNNDFSHILNKFIEREKPDKSLKCMAFALVGRGDGIQYKNLLVF